MHYAARALPSATVHLGPPEDVVLASLFVDDGMPGLNPMALHQPHYGHAPHISNATLQAFAAAVGELGLAGKFSVVPYPLGLGRIDQEVPGVRRTDVHAFLDIVRREIAPRFDLTPELLTHGPAVDPHTGYLTHLTEKEWGSDASAAEWAAYFRMAFALLRNVGLEAAGTTSPWDTGADNEDAMARGLDGAALELGRQVTFYFVHAADHPERAFPEVRVLHREDPGLPRAVVSVKCMPVDPAWPLQYGRPHRLDRLIGESGEEGIALRFAQAGAPVVFVTHWQSLDAAGSAAGVAVVRQAVDRLRSRFGRAVRWTTASALATLAAAGAALTAVEDEAGNVTLSLPIASDLAELRVLAEAGRPFDPAAVRTAAGAAVPAAALPGGGVRIGAPPAGTFSVFRRA